MRRLAFQNSTSASCTIAAYAVAIIVAAAALPAPAQAASSVSDASSNSSSAASDASSNVPGSATSSYGSSNLGGPFFSPLHSSLPSAADSAGAVGSAGASSISSSGSNSDFEFVPSDVDYGPSPKLLEIHKVTDGQEGNSDNYYEMTVWSPANHATVKNGIILPAGGQENSTPRSTLYLFAGATGGERGSNWHLETDFEDFFADKNVNVVALYGGAESLYADWLNDDPALGRNKWQTYMGEELPQVMAENFHDNGIDAIAGCSMGGGPSLALAANYPDRFKAAASLSGYPSQSGLFGRILASQTIGEGNSSNLYGSQTNEAWQLADPAFDPARLKNTKVFVAHSWGIPILSQLSSLRWPLFMGLEWLSAFESTFFYQKALSAGINVTLYQIPFGAHSYANFEQELYAGWNQVISPALNS